MDRCDESRWTGHGDRRIDPNRHHDGVDRTDRVGRSDGDGVGVGKCGRGDSEDAGSGIDGDADGAAVGITGGVD